MIEISKIKFNNKKIIAKYFVVIPDSGLKWNWWFKVEMLHYISTPENNLQQTITVEEKATSIPDLLDNSVLTGSR